MKGSKLKMYKRLELRMFWVHSNSVEPKVQHVLCHIFNVLNTFSYIGEPARRDFQRKCGKVRKAVFVVFVWEPPRLKKSRNNLRTEDNIKVVNINRRSS